MRKCLTKFSRIYECGAVPLFRGTSCASSGGRLPEALFMVFLLDSKGPKGPFSSSGGRLPAALFMVFQLDSKAAKVQKRVYLVDLVQNFQTSIYLQTSAGFDTAENGPLKNEHSP